ncbi:hypothetical protein BDY17DRAFT_109662 [Neohortaea acidophila]|uniref:Uncharacterized protein n=1 Tax=Neohortaea acidophila TaxID=245834 RepID=A0A6A6Q105_9PEZI|nr:uncharacterized protein BDY17DRAFT_109662 [Neohortaea acidophila]KAF2485659.1 hypothetical protein BDY17DRAFT_109662 [Neohortaea acidophila]
MDAEQKSECHASRSVCLPCNSCYSQPSLAPPSSMCSHDNHPSNSNPLASPRHSAPSRRSRPTRLRPRHMAINDHRVLRIQSVSSPHVLAPTHQTNGVVAELPDPPLAAATRGFAVGFAVSEEVGRPFARRAAAGEGEVSVEAHGWFGLVLIRFRKE